MRLSYSGSQQSQPRQEHQSRYRGATLRAPAPERLLNSAGIIRHRPVTRTLPCLSSIDRNLTTRSS